MRAARAGPGACLHFCSVPFLLLRGRRIVRCLRSRLRQERSVEHRQRLSRSSKTRNERTMSSNVRTPRSRPSIPFTSGRMIPGGLFASSAQWTSSAPLSGAILERQVFQNKSSIQRVLRRAGWICTTFLTVYPSLNRQQTRPFVLC